MTQMPIFIGDTQSSHRTGPKNKKETPKQRQVKAIPSMGVMGTTTQSTAQSDLMSKSSLKISKTVAKGTSSKLDGSSQQIGQHLMKGSGKGGNSRQEPNTV